MTRPGGYVHVPSINHDYEHRDDDQKARDGEDRAAVLRALLTFSQARELDPVSTIELTEMLGLDDEVDELAGDRRAGGRAAERHRRLAELRELAGLTPDELEDHDAAAE